MANKPWRTNVVLTLGMVHTYVDLWPVKVSGAGTSLFRNVCPTCTVGDQPVGINQINRCPNCHKDIPNNELGKARKVSKDKMVKMTDEDLAAIRAAFPVRQSDLMVCDAEEFVASTLPNGTAYTLRPAGKFSSSAYLLLRELVASEPNHVYYGKLKADESANPSPFRLDIWKGELLLTTVVPPASLDTVGEIAGHAEPKYLGMAKMLVEQIKAPFDADFLADVRIERINEILAAKEAGNPIVAAAAAPAPQSDDLMAALEASLGKNKADQGA